MLVLSSLWRSASAPRRAGPRRAALDPTVATPVAPEGAMSERRFERRVALITGAGTGIGRELALAYAREGARIAIGARRIEPLEETARLVAEAGGECLVVRAD